ncbi:MAG TPA: hypothetical protein VG754_07610 [Verrucomicrobiae bacterium]|nr:hypothetical protein [Verrucomicrobiae bacterium]
MKRYWEGLKPLERRWAVGAGCLVFLMLNYFFIWPHRHDWARDDTRTHAAEAKIATYNAEIAKKSAYLTKLRNLQAMGDQVLPEDQAIDFVHFYSSRMLSNNILFLSGGTLTTRTNSPFFMEQQLGISVQANETNLVNFLYSLAAGNSMVRVRSMSLHPNPDRHELSAGITMVASYQKKVSATASKNATPPLTPVKNVIQSPRPAAPAIQPVNNHPAPPPMMGSKLPPPPAMNMAAMSNRMAHFLKPGMTNRPPQKNAN